MRRLQLEHSAEIGRSVMNFAGGGGGGGGGPADVFLFRLRYHGGAFVAFAKTLTKSIEIAAIEGARAWVIGGASAAEVIEAVRSEELGEVRNEYDRVHSVERALKGRLA
jgi:hypothetical protein